MTALNIANETIRTTATAKTPKTAKNTRKPAKRVSKKPYTRSELARVTAFASVALAGLAVSLPHLAGEIGTLTGAGAVAAWFLAIVIDAGMIAAKTHTAMGVESYANRVVSWVVISACTLLSMVLNAHAFTTHANSAFGCVMGAAFGMFLPVFIMAMSYLACGILARHADA